MYNVSENATMQMKVLSRNRSFMILKKSNENQVVMRANVEFLSMSSILTWTDDDPDSTFELVNWDFIKRSIRSCIMFDRMFVMAKLTSRATKKLQTTCMIAIMVFHLKQKWFFSIVSMDEL